MISKIGVLSLLLLCFLPVSALHTESENNLSSFSRDDPNNILSYGVLAGWSSLSLKRPKAQPGDKKEIIEEYVGWSLSYAHRVSNILQFFWTPPSYLHNYFLYTGFRIKRARVYQDKDDFTREEEDNFFIEQPSHTFLSLLLGVRYYFQPENFYLSLTYIDIGTSYYTRTSFSEYADYYGKGIEAVFGKPWKIYRSIFLSTELLYSYTKLYCQPAGYIGESGHTVWLYEDLCSQTKGTRHDLGLGLNISAYLL